MQAMLFYTFGLLQVSLISLSDSLLTKVLAQSNAQCLNCKASVYADLNPTWAETIPKMRTGHLFAYCVTSCIIKET